MMERIYLDHAATSWPKPPGVLEALVEYQQVCGAAAGRGNYDSASRANQIVSNVRRKLALLISAQRPSEIALLDNGTAALNVALVGLLKSGDHVVTSAAEHNSILRPLAALRKERGVSFTIVPVDSSGTISPQQIQIAMTTATKMVAVTHASNVTGCVQPIDEISAIAKRHRAWLLVDGAQTLGYLPIDVRSSGIDMLAAPGHKGACGMLGTGMLYARQEIAEQIQTPWPGGTGTESEHIEGPYGWPAGVESGNMNVPAIAAWDSGLDWLMSKSMHERWSETRAMSHRLLEILKASSLGKIIGHLPSTTSVSLVSLAVSKMACSDLAALLDSSFRIEVRSGMHCAACIHEYLETKAIGGTLRFSLGHTSTDHDLDGLEVACRSLKQSGVA